MFDILMRSAEGSSLPNNKEPVKLTWIGETYDDTGGGRINPSYPHVHMEGGKHVQSRLCGVAPLQLLCS